MFTDVPIAFFQQLQEFPFGLSGSALVLDIEGSIGSILKSDDETQSQVVAERLHVEKRKRRASELSI